MSSWLRFWKVISRRGAEFCHMLPLNINRKPYMGIPMTLSHLSDLKRSISKSLSFQKLISRKSDALGHMLPLNTNRKSYMVSPKPPSYLTLSNLDRSKLGYYLKCIYVQWGTVLELTLDFNGFSLMQWVFDTNVQKIANVIPTTRFLDLWFNKCSFSFKFTLSTVAQIFSD